ncbi:hypothetical protein HJFPF1_02545 [Paramyrothecium foliicola]|nr:hypothetical protein HJFPF1_02545 [Paramyrothecium foliicola]
MQAFKSSLEVAVQQRPVMGVCSQTCFSRMAHGEDRTWHRALIRLPNGMMIRFKNGPQTLPIWYLPFARAMSEEALVAPLLYLDIVADVMMLGRAHANRARFQSMRYPLGRVAGACVNRMDTVNAWIVLRRTSMALRAMTVGNVTWRNKIILFNVPGDKVELDIVPGDDAVRSSGAVTMSSFSDA